MKCQKLVRSEKEWKMVDEMKDLRKDEGQRAKWRRKRNVHFYERFSVNDYRTTCGYLK